MSEGDSLEYLPDVKECEKRCKQFSEITAANSIEAQMFLQQHDWNLEKAVQNFFETEGHSAAESQEPLQGASNAKGSEADLSQNPSEIVMLSWNLDGLDNLSLRARTHAALEVIKAENPDIIFLQEVVALSWQIIKQEMEVQYFMLPACTHSQYYTAVLLRKGTVLMDRSEVKPFHSSMMMRKLQVVYINVKGIDMKVMNTHLESTATHKVERMRQFKICMDELSNSNSDVNVLFGGDLNLGARDESALVIPPNVVDLWVATGSKPEKRYTWDMKYNDNKVMSGGGTPRCRFDRIFFRPSANNQVKPSEFHLRGIERVKNRSRFPSDHWALLCKFTITTDH